MTLNELEEKPLIDELRRRMKGKMTQEMYEDDNLFARFLRARNHDMDAAELMLTNNVNWRRTNNVDALTLPSYRPPEVCLKYINPTTTGYSKDGTPVKYIHLGGFDTRGTLKSARRTDIVNFLVSVVETDLKEMKENNEKNGKHEEQWIYVFNLDNLLLSTATHKPTIETLINFFVTYDVNYPERLKTAYVINASFYFALGWTLIKPFISGNTINKIKIFGKDGWQEEFQKNVDLDLIPAFLGGRMTDPDGNPMCRTKICLGGPVHESYYITKSAMSLASLPNTKKLMVNRRARAEVKIEVMYPGSTIDWEFEVKNRDIAFSLHYRIGHSIQDSLGKELIPKRRIETSLTTETGIFKAEKAGTYVLEFDNAYSWMHGKEIYYITSITRPQNNSSVIH